MCFHAIIHAILELWAHKDSTVVKAVGGGIEPATEVTPFRLN